MGYNLYTKIKKHSYNTVFLDSDSFREILGNDLGHTPNNRLKNAKRISRKYN